MENFRKLISSELRLIALLSRPEMKSAQVSEAKLILEKKINNTLFKTLLDQHRVWPCVYLNIQSHFIHHFPEDVITYLKKKYQQNVYLRMRQFRVESDLLIAFKDAGIPLAPFKGNSLAKKLYGDIAKRHSHDVDLVTKREYLQQANQILNRLGFKCDVFDELTPKQLSICLGSQKDLGYMDKDGFLIELHIRLSARPSSLSDEFINKLLSSDLQAKHSDHEFIYLCWHAAQNLHFRLKWLLDIALYIQHNTSKDNEFQNRVWTLAEELGAGRHVAISWMLSDILYKLNIMESVPQFYLTDQTTLELIEKSLLRLENNIEVQSLRFWLLLRMREFVFCKGLAPRLSILNHMLFNPCSVDMQKMSKIPDSLSFIHYLIRPFFVVRRILNEIN